MSSQPLLQTAPGTIYLDHIFSPHGHCTAEVARIIRGETEARLSAESPAYRGLHGISKALKSAGAQDSVRYGSAVPWGPNIPPRSPAPPMDGVGFDGAGLDGARSPVPSSPPSPLPDADKGAEL